MKSVTTATKGSSMKTMKTKMPMMDEATAPKKTPAGFAKKAKPNAFKAPTKATKGNPFAKKAVK